MKKTITMAAGALLVASGAAYADLSITEIMYNPASAEDDWEWVEIVNTGASAIDFAATPWVIDDINSIAHTEANIASGSIGAGEVAVLYNADDISAADFEAAWGAGLNLIPVTSWNVMALNNGGDTIGLWNSFASYDGDNETQANAVLSLAYDDGSPWPADDGNASIHLLGGDKADGANWALSDLADGISYESLAGGGNVGGEVANPGSVVPGPAALAALGLAGLAGRRRRRA